MLAYKKKRKLTMAVIAFMLTFIVGAAFAAQQGALQVGGGIGVGVPNLRVQWVSTDLDTNTPVVGTATTNVARIVNFMGRPGAAAMGEMGIDDRLEWAIGFTGAGTVTLNATAHNYGSLPAEVAAPTHFSWDDPFSDYYNMFTITYTMTGTTGTATSGTWPVTLQPGETVDVRITVNWNGGFPPGGYFPLEDPPLDNRGDEIGLRTTQSTPPLNWTTDNWLPGLGIGLMPGDPVGTQPLYRWANSFFFNLVYTVAP
ncbi:MAG: hypothetical protein FWB91_07380 [Defluviitaleaceae bacterium]|nr:hypothetical protein [Defluviitaleaceae bacterium]